MGKVKRNFQVYTEHDGAPIKAWVNGVKFEDDAKKQLENLASLPFIYKWVSAMPDVHVGKGATIGSVIATKGAVIPAAVGLDCNCGMRVARIGLKRSDVEPLKDAIYHSLDENIPNGRTDEGQKNDIGRWHEPPEVVLNTWNKELKDKYNYLGEIHPWITENKVSWEHLGTLGTGNHMCEICVDLDDQVWILIHSGSRGMGARIGNYFIKKAKQECKKWFIELPDPELAYFPKDTQWYSDYLFALDIAKIFADKSRQIMLDIALQTVEDVVGKKTDVDFNIDCHHNYASMEHHYGENVLVTRKGAVRAREKDWCIIPGSMGAQTFICQGKGNKKSFTSCSHGAGRAMTRTKAKKTISIEEHNSNTLGVACCKDERVLEESPKAYKDISLVMKAQEDLVKPVYELKQIVCLKGKD